MAQEHSVSHGQGLWDSPRTWGTLGLETVIARNHWFFCSSRDQAESCNLWVCVCVLVSSLQAAPPKGLHQGSSFSLCRGEGTSYTQTGWEGSSLRNASAKFHPKTKTFSLPWELCCPHLQNQLWNQQGKAFREAGPLGLLREGLLLSAGAPFITLVTTRVPRG